MKFNKKDLLEELIAVTRQNIASVKSLQSLSSEKLNSKYSADSWSSLECVEHLNRYADFYTKEIGKRLKQNKRSEATTFSSGRLGNYFAISMKPSDKMKKMKTFKSMNPKGSNLDKSILGDFIAHQQEMLNYLEEARTIDLEKTKTSITISSLIKLKLGDTFRVVIYHNERHIIQAQRALQAIAA